MGTLLKVERPHTPPVLVSFSGVDGAGKTTQIASLRAWMHSCGLRTRLFAFWDDVVVGKRYREGFVHTVYGSEPGVGAPGKPVNRRDKNVRAWYLALPRQALYLLDAFQLVFVIGRAKREPVDVILFDRYLYDELVNLPLRNPLVRAFVKMVADSVPQPEIAYLLDADIEAAHARKPEYPADFMHKCRQDYFLLARLLGNITIIPPLELERAKEEVIETFVNCAILHNPNMQTEKKKFPKAAA